MYHLLLLIVAEFISVLDIRNKYIHWCTNLRRMMIFIFSIIALPTSQCFVIESNGSKRLEIVMTVNDYITSMIYLYSTYMFLDMVTK